MIKLKDILLENDNELGKWAFADPKYTIAPKFIKLQGKEAKEEPNTEIEDEILDLLITWTRSYNNDTDIRTANKLYAYKDLFDKARKIYPKIFKPNKKLGTMVYRGIIGMGTQTNKSDSIIELVKNSGKTDYIKCDDIAGYKFSRPIKYTPHKQIQSWTTEKNVANRFSWGLLLTTALTDNFFMNPNTLNALFTNDAGYFEYEILHFGKDYIKPVYLIIDLDTYNNLRD